MNTIRRKNRERGGALQVVLSILGALAVLAALVVLVAIWAVNRFVKIEVDRSGEGKRVAIHTPVGEFGVEKGGEAASRLRLPVYPGAEEEEEPASVRLWGRAGEEQGGLTILAASYRTEDEFDSVDTWYQQQLSAEFIREEGRIVGGERRGGRDGEWMVRVEPGGTDVLYRRETGGRIRAVALRREFGWVKIGLFDLQEAREQ